MLSRLGRKKRYLEKCFRLEKLLLVEGTVGGRDGARLH